MKTGSTPMISLQSESPAAETLLITLYARAWDAQQPCPILRDEHAVAMVERIDYDFTRFQLSRSEKVSVMMRHREHDRLARDFLARNHKAVVVHIGCGLDTRFERVDDGLVTWYDLDLPEVIELRRQLIPERTRRRDLGYSVLDSAWLDVVGTHIGRPFLFLAEGVLQYLEEAEVRDLFLTLMERFPGSELDCDALTPLGAWAFNLSLAVHRLGARVRWSLARGRDLERWGEGIRLLDELWPDREGRLSGARLLGLFPQPSFSRIHRYQLGSKTGQI